MARVREAEIRERRDTMLRLVAGGKTLHEAAKTAGLSSDRVVRLMDSADFLRVYSAIREGQLGPTAVSLEPALDAAA